MSERVAVRSQSCSACPYRRDVPSGVWAEQEYEKLVEYDRPTGDQPLGAFRCHATPESYCHGWVNVHSNRGHEHELLALRLTGDVPDPDDRAMTKDPALFDSGTEAAEHGKRELDDPSDEAIETAARLQRKYERLR